jgi:hypothetical protein
MELSGQRDCAIDEKTSAKALRQNVLGTCRNNKEIAISEAGAGGEQA